MSQESVKRRYLRRIDRSIRREVELALDRGAELRTGGSHDLLLDMKDGGRPIPIIGSFSDRRHLKNRRALIRRRLRGVNPPGPGAPL